MNRTRGLLKRAVAVTVVAGLLISPAVAAAAPANVIVPVGRYPENVAISPDGTKAYVTSPPDATITVVDTATHAVLNKISVNRGPFEVAFTPDGTKAFTANAYDNAISVVDTASETMHARLQGGGYPLALAVSPSGDRLYVGGGAAVRVFDARTNAELTDVAMPYRPAAISVAPDGAKVWTVNEDSTMSAIDTATNTVLETFAIGAGRDLALSPDGSRAYVNGGDHVAVVDLVTREVTRIPGIVNGYLLAISPDGSHVYAGSRRSDTVQGSLVEIDTRTNTITRSLPAGAYPYGIAITADGQRAFVVLAGQAALAIIDL